MKCVCGSNEFYQVYINSTPRLCYFGYYRCVNCGRQYHQDSIWTNHVKDNENQKCKGK